MRIVILSSIFILLFFIIVQAGQISGKIIYNGKPAPRDTRIVITHINSQTTDSSTLDRYGGYKVYLRKSGKCEFTVTYKGDTLNTLEILSFSGRKTYNFKIYNDNGKFKIKKR